MTIAERGRLRAPGRRVDTGADHLLLIVHESNGAWTLYEGSAGVRLEAGVMVALCQAVLDRAAGGHASWYLRSTAKRDTHRAEGVHRDGCVVAACGARFRPLLVRGHKALPGKPSDPEQVCPGCRQGAATGSARMHAWPWTTAARRGVRAAALPDQPAGGQACPDCLRGS